MRFNLMVSGSTVRSPSRPILAAALSSEITLVMGTIRLNFNNTSATTLPFLHNENIRLPNSFTTD